MGGECYWYACVGAKDAAKHPILHRALPTTKNHLEKNVSIAEAENLRRTRI